MRRALKGKGAGGRALPAPSALLVRSLLAWYERNRRAFPWRAPPGAVPDPYRVWLSEIMLQQTTTAAVRPYFEVFLARWPRIEDLAAARLDDVLHAWQGLGYYARARNLHECAKAVVARYGGRFPKEEKALKQLPGIGPYTAAAIAAIAFARPAVVVDGNVRRVLARLACVERPWPEAKAELEALAAALSPRARAGDYAQALMDLGATLCTPRAPRCEDCPWRWACRAYANGVVDVFPRRALGRSKPTRHGVAFWAVRSDGRLLLRRRDGRGLLGGMMEIPSTDWREEAWSVEGAARYAPVKADWRRLPGVVRHGFTHFDLVLVVLVGRIRAGSRAEGVWALPEELGRYALPTLMKKVAGHPGGGDLRPAEAGAGRPRIPFSRLG